MSNRVGAFSFDLKAFLFVALVLTALRVVFLVVSPLGLHFDEAQYWWWSRSLDWGYFSKPPLIGWTIAATTFLFGDDPWAVRLAAPFAHALGAFALFALAARLYSPRAGLWAGIGWLLMPGVQLSSGLISTDALFLPLWCAALYAFDRFVESRSWTWAASLGVAAGFGMLAKYGMGYFPLCAALAAWWSPRVRAALFSRHALAAWGAALAIMAPNAAWNVAHRFATVAHTADNANLGGSLFHLEEALDFITSQTGVLGPALFIALIVFIFFAARAPGKLDERDKFLLAFIVPPLVIIIGQAFLTRAHANWAAAAYPAALVWLSGRLLDTRLGRGVLWGSAGLHAVFGAVLIVAMTWPGVIDGVSSKRPRGMREAAAWDVTADEIAAAVDAADNEAPVSAILVDHRALFFELAYHWRDRPSPPAPVRMWVLGAEAGNHAEAAQPMRPEDGARVLVVSMTPAYWPLIEGDFTRFEEAGALSIPLGGGARRDLRLAYATGFAPVPRDDAYLAPFRPR